MRRKGSFRNDYAVSEVVGGIILIMVAVISFAAIYTYLFPPPPDINANVEIRGFLTNDGLIVLEHVGGNPIENYRIDIRYPNGIFVCSYSPEEAWSIGKYQYPLKDTGIRLADENDILCVDVYITNEDGSEEQIFTWDATGRSRAQSVVPTDGIMLISSLRTDTTDEDLICFNDTILPSIDASSYIYKWMIDGTPFAEVILAFDIEDNSAAKDYSGNGYNGIVTGAAWSPNGKVGGTYYFDGGNDLILFDLPSAFNNIGSSEFSVSYWIKSDDITAPHKVVMEASESNKNFARFFQYESKIQFGVCIDGTKYVLETDTASTNTWYHIVGTWDGDTDTMGLYINGEAVNSTNIGYREFSISSNDGSFEVGHGAPGGGGYWKGYIDEVEVTPRVLSAEHIYQQYISTKDGFSDKRVIVSEETSLGQTWQCVVTPNDGVQDDTVVESNFLQIIGYPGGVVS